MSKADEIRAAAEKASKETGLPVDVIMEIWAKASGADEKEEEKINEQDR